jgi:hypothetical protein
VTEPRAGQPGACPRCGAPYSPGQEYCLECGLRLPTETGWFASFIAPWRRRRWYPGDWIWPVLLFLLLAGLGAVIAILATRNSNNETIVATPPQATTGGGGFGVTNPPTTAPPPTTTAAPTTTPPPRTTPVRNTLVEWPARNGWTVVLQSIPTTSSRSQAVRTARRALAAGLQQVGVLDSSNYSSLHPGYYVVFTGIFRSNAEAQSHLAGAEAAGFPVAYVRPVTQ